jgi:FkbM family methyltransferase
VLGAGKISRKRRLDLLEELQAPARMDYDSEEILLRQSSRKIEIRLRSASKEPWTVSWIEEWFRPGDVFYDIGANVGAYALLAAKASGKTVRTFAFEPSAPTYHDLCLNIALNDCADCVTPLPFALWSETALIPFGHLSLVPGSSSHAFSFDGDEEILFHQRQPALSLDDAARLFDLPSPSHVKLDTEACELEILAGATTILAASRLRSIMIELDPDESTDAVEAHLDPHGFELVETYRRKPGGVFWNLYAR